MKLSETDLHKALRAGNIAAIAKLFRGTDETEREAVAPEVKEWCQRLERNWRAQFDRKTAERVESEGAISGWLERMPAAHLAALACLSLAQIKSLHLVGRAEPALIAEVLRDRRPNWLDDYAAHLCGRDLHRWTTGDWKLVRHLVREGLCQPPALDTYVLGAINGIKPPSNWRENLQRKEAGLPPLPEPSLVDLFLAERDWLDTAFWRLFELEGTGEVSLANGEKYSHGQSWTTAIVELSQRGVLSRERLLDASLAALNRDFIQFRAGWFSRFHEAMSPTTAEREQRLPAYFQLLGSAIPPTVTFALKAIQALDKEKPIPGTHLARHLESALTSRSKVAVTGALQLLDRAARRDKHFAARAAQLATLALMHESPQVQEQAFDLLDKHSRPDDPELRQTLAERSEHVAASLRTRLKPWLGKSATGKTTPVVHLDRPQTELQGTPPSRLDPSRALTSIPTLDELILAASAALESPDNPMLNERVLDSLSRLGAERPADFEARVGPLRKRALKKRDEKQGSWPRHPELERALAMLLLSWTDNEDAFTESAIKLGHGQNQFAFLFRRLRVLGDFLRTGKSLPLLSAPTHQGGWIEPRALVMRWRAWQEAWVAPDIHEQVLALLRLAPEGHAVALPEAGAITGESGDALRFALGANGCTGRNAALWLAACRSRQPHGDLPEFEKAHPKLGPDAGEAARYEWDCRGEHHEHGDSKWNSFELSFALHPKPPRKIGDALLPVLRHGEWQTCEESAKGELRWAASLWPAHTESLFAHCVKRLAVSVDYADALDREFCAYLEPLADPHTEMRPMAALALALGLAAEDVALRGHAQEGLIAIIAQGRLDLPVLAGVMARLLATGINKFARWAKALREVARVSPLHTAQVAELLRRSFHGDPAKAPRDIHALLELLVELLAETGGRLQAPETRAFLQGLKAGGRTANLVRRLLA